jgi:hypothetical protein
MTRTHGRPNNSPSNPPRTPPKGSPGGKLESEQLMKKQHFLILTSTFCLFLSGCESPQVTRQNEMAEARALVAAQYGDRLSPAQEAYLTMQVFQRMEAERNENARVSAAIISNGFNNAANIMANSSRTYVPQYIQPIQYNVQPMQIPAPAPFVPIPVSRY